MSKTHPNNPTKQPRPSKTNSTQSEPGPIERVLEDALKLIQDARAAQDRAHEREKPLLDFHEAAREANASDIRLFWDVRMVKGENTPFAHSKGQMSMPGLLHTKTLPIAPAKVEAAVLDSIASPLMAAIMELTRAISAGEVEHSAQRLLIELGPGTHDETRHQPGVMDLAAQHDRMSGKVTLVAAESEEENQD